MIDAWSEGVRAIVQACNLVILAPMALLVVAARGRWPAVVGAVAGVALGGWVFATRWLVLSDLGLRLSALLVVAAFAALALPAVGRSVPAVVASVRDRVDDPGVAIAIAIGVGAIVTLWWRPCVGERLGEILTRAPDEPLGQFLPTVAFMLGVAMPLVVLGLVDAVWQPRHSVAERLGVLGAGLGAVLAASVVVGQHGEIVARLFEWSQ